MSPRRRVVVATADTLSATMAGAAIRARQLAAALSVAHDVCLATTGGADLTDLRFEIRAVDDAALDGLGRRADVVVAQGWVLARSPALLHSDTAIVCDLYDPLHLEQLEQTKHESANRRLAVVSDAVAVLNQQLLRGDFFVCASEKQRDLWLGQLGGLGRLNHRTSDEDPSLRSLIGVVPFGVSDDPPRRTGRGVRGVIPGIGADDDLLIWGGGLYDWLDPVTLVRAVGRLAARRPTVRLLFMGVRHPNPAIAAMSVEMETRRVAGELGLIGSHVFFNEQWVPYDERQNVLLDGDLGVSTHHDHLEAAFAYRTRVLDYLWTSLPIVATAGDALADLVERRALGLTVPAGDVAALEGALFRLLDDKGLAAACRTRIEALVPSMTWSECVRPLVEFCDAPRRAPDLVDGPIASRLRRGPPLAPAPSSGWRHDAQVGLDLLRAGNPGLLVRRIAGRLRRLAAGTAQPERP